MFNNCVFFVVISVISVKTCLSQIILFGECIDVETMKYFSIDGFLGKWYEIQRFPAWYANYSHCPYKRIQSCGRNIAVEHVFVREGIQYILHVNTTYAPGDEAILNFRENNIDPVGIPMTVISTDYTNYALVYGCKYRADLDLKYPWILSRESSLSSELLQRARDELNSIPYAHVIYLETVDHTEENCLFHWTADVQAVNFYDDDDDEDDED